MKKLLFILIISGLVFGCNSDNQTESNKEEIIEVKNQMEVSFEMLYYNEDMNMIVGYTNDPDSLWLDPEWLSVIKYKMRDLIFGEVVILFNSEKNTPDITNLHQIRKIIAQEYDKDIICKSWKYTTGVKKFCYGGIKEDGDFVFCEESNDKNNSNAVKSEEVKYYKSEFDQVGYYKSANKNRCFAYTYSKDDEAQILQHAKKQMHTSGQITTVYYFSYLSKTYGDNITLSNSYLEAYDYCYDLNWKYMYMISPNGEAAAGLIKNE